MARRAGRDARELIEQAGGSIPNLFPAGDEAEVLEHMRKLPHQYREVVERYVGHCANATQRIVAAAAVTILVQQEMQPNSSFTMWPATLAPGANATVNTVYALQPFKGAAAQGNFQFVAGMRYFGLMTGKVDVQAGWCITADSLLFSIDAISGIHAGDCSFAEFEEDVVWGRMITGEYQRHEILEQITFTCSAILRSTTPAPMVEGVTVQYWDERCKNEKQIGSYFDVIRVERFSHLVRELMEAIGAGLPVERLGRHMRRHLVTG